MVAAALTLACAIFVLWNRSPGWVKTKRSLLLTFFYGGALVWMAGQIIPGIPEHLVHPMWREVSHFLDYNISARISLSPSDSWWALMKTAAYGGVFITAALLCERSVRSRFVIKAVAIAVSFYSIYGLFVYFSGQKMVLWIEKAAYFDDVTSTFINRNTFATFSGLGILCNVYWILRNIELQSHQNQKGKSRFSARDFFEIHFKSIITPCVGMSVTTTALLLSHSRGGFVATVIGLIIFFLIKNLGGKRKRNSVVATLVLVGFVMSYVLVTSGKGVLERLESEELTGNLRWDVYEKVMEGIHAAPVTGHGVGTFDQGFRQYESESLSHGRWDKAHSSPLENWFELGLYGGTALNFSVIMLGIGFLSGICIRKRNKLLPALGLAIVMLVSIHSLVDFSLQIPGFTIVFVLVVGALWPQAFDHTRRHA